MKIEYIERMKAELKALNHSIEKIESFVQEGKYQDLTEEEFDLLNEQYDYMRSYAKTLTDRITLAEEKESKRVVFTVKITLSNGDYLLNSFDNIKNAFTFITVINAVSFSDVLKVSLKSKRKG